MKIQKLLQKLDHAGPFISNKRLSKIIAQADKAGHKHPNIDFAKGVLAARIVG